MRKFFGFFFLFLLIPLILGSSPLSVRLKRESISLCYGIFYGNIISMESLQFFVHYYHNLGVERIVAFLHPSLNQSLSLFQETGLSITMWDSNYTYDRISHHQNHKLAIEQCISTETYQSNATTIIVCDPDEFLYFDPKVYGSFQSFLASFRKSGVGQLYLSRVYYEIDLCLKQNEQNRSIWDSPYTGPDAVAPFGKSIFFTDNFLGLPDKKFEHLMNVSGQTVHVDHFKAHFKHFRRFLTWDGKCQVVKETKLQYQEHRDKLDPSKKKFFSAHEYFFYRDLKLFRWRDFVENEADNQGDDFLIVGKKEIKRWEKKKRKGEGKRPFRKGKTNKN